MPSGFIPNPGFVPALVAAGEMKGMLSVVGEKVAGTAQSIAPVDTGAYRDSIRVDLQTGSVDVSANVPYAVFVEFGTSDTPVFAVLRRALEAGT